MISKNCTILYYCFTYIVCALLFNCFIHLGQCTHLKIYLAIKLLTPLNFFIKEVSPLF